MAYSNFIPTVWNEAIHRELERLCVFAEDCNRLYEGDVKKLGDSVVILGVGKPTVKTLARDGSTGNIDAAEEIEDTSVLMPIRQIRYYNYMIGDIDRRQAVGSVMDALNKETCEALACEMDKYIAALATDSTVEALYSTVPKLVTGTASSGEKNVLDALDEAIQKLYEKDVSPATPLTVTVSPRFYNLFKKAYTDRSTENEGVLANGRIARYAGVTVKLSNNVATTSSGTVDNIMLRTPRAVAFANPCIHTEPYRPETKFADAIKGYTLFDAKVVRPAEIININVKYA